jgi:hypothetical protein
MKPLLNKSFRFVEMRAVGSFPDDTCLFSSGRVKHSMRVRNRPRPLMCEVALAYSSMTIRVLSSAVAKKD